MHKATMLLPGGKGNRILKWMTEEIAYRGSFGETITATELAEAAADAFGRAAWLDDSDHWVWAAACIAVDAHEHGS